MGNPIIDYQEIIAAIVGGIIGIFGSTATFVVSRTLRRGRICVHLCNWEIEFRKQDNFGGFGSTTKIKEAKRAEYHIELDFYNSSDDPKSIRNIKIEFKQNKKSIINTPYYLIGKSGATQYVTVLNIAPKQFLHESMWGVIKEEELDTFSQDSIVIFNAILPNGRKFKTKIADIAALDY